MFEMHWTSFWFGVGLAFTVVLIRDFCGERAKAWGARLKELKDDFTDEKD